MATEVQTGRTVRATQPALDSITVEQFTDGVLDPARPMLGPIRSGGQAASTCSTLVNSASAAIHASASSSSYAPGPRWRSCAWMSAPWM